MRFVLCIALAPFVVTLAGALPANAAASSKSGLGFAQSKTVEAMAGGEVQAFEFVGPGGNRITHGGVATKPVAKVTPTASATSTSAFHIEKRAATGTRTSAQTREASTVQSTAVRVESQSNVSSEQRGREGLALLRRMAVKRTSESIEQKQMATARVALDPALEVLRTLSDEDLAYFAAIPAASVVKCGGQVPVHHLLSSKIADAGQRDALRNWVRGGGNWKSAVLQIQRERGL